LIRSGDYDVNKYSFTDILAVGAIAGEIFLPGNDHYVVCGQVSLIDFIKYKSN
jgi:hypothetical protein